MTGYGAGSAEIDGLLIRVEVRSVNHRHLDIRVHTRSELRFEREIEPLIRNLLGRGRVDLSIEVTGSGDADACVSVDHPKARAHYAALTELAEELGMAERPTLSMIAA